MLVKQLKELNTVVGLQPYLNTRVFEKKVFAGTTVPFAVTRFAVRSSGVSVILVTFSAIPPDLEQLQAVAPCRA